MTTVFDKGAGSAPATHVLIIGVGRYDHLLGGSGTPMANAMGLTQLTSPPISARAMCDWFLTRHNNPDAPLGSVEMLLSPGGSDVAEPTKHNIAHSFETWFERLRASPKSIGVFYFSGHGIFGNGQYLLPSDFGAGLNLWANAIEISSTIQALQRRLDGPLYFFIDACRQVSRAVALSVGANAPALLDAPLNREVNASSTVLYATAEGASAYSKADLASRFTQALIHGLSGFSARRLPGENLWAITGEDIYRSVERILSTDKLAADVRQLPSVELRSPTTFQVLDTPPRDAIELNAMIWTNALRARDREAGVDARARTQHEAAPRTQPKPGIKVFISCAKPDLQVGRNVYRLLSDRGHNPWLADESLLPGQNWVSETSKSLRESDLFLTLVSQQALTQRGTFHKELREALNILKELPPMQTFVVPARVDDCKPEYDELRELFWVDLFPEFQPGMERILKAIDAHRDGKAGTT